MPIDVELPDGEIVEFPDNMTDDQINAAIQQNFPQFAQQTPIAPEPEKPIVTPEMAETDIYAETPEELAAAEAEKGVKTGSIFKRIKEVFTGAGRKTPETEALPEFLAREPKKRKTIFGTEAPETVSRRIIDTITQSGDPESNLITTAGMLSTFKPEKQKEIIKANIPEAEFETDAKGNTIINIAGKRSILNKPGFSETDMAQAIATTLAFLPSAKLAQLGKGLLTQSLIGGVAAGATEAGLGEVAQAAGAEEGASIGEVGTAAAIEMLLPPAAKLVKRVGRGIFRMSDDQLRTVPGMTPEIEANIKQAKEAAQTLETATGQKATLYPAQQIATQAETMKMKIISQLSEGSEKAYQSFAKQNIQAREITDSLIDQITKSSTITAPEQFKAAAELAIEAQKQIRREAASPLYKKALKAGGKPDTTNIKNVVDSFLDEAEPGMPIYNQVAKINKWLTQTPTLKKLHNAKITINDWIARKGDKSLDNTVKRALIEINEQIKKSLIDASPLYKQADEEFARLSPAIDQLKQSITGQVAKIDPASPQIQNIARRVFSGSEKDIRQMKKIIDDVDPNAFDTLLKAEMSDIVSKAVDGFAAADTLKNIPGQLGKALFGDFKKKKAMLAAMSHESQKNFRYLETYLERAAAGRAPGSPTAAYTEAIKKVQSPTMLIRDWLTSPVKNAQQLGETTLLNKRLQSLAELTFDPNWQPKLSKIRKMSKGKMNSATVARAMAQLLNDVEMSINPENLKRTAAPLQNVAGLQGEQRQ